MKKVRNRQTAIQEFWERRTKLVEKKRRSFRTSHMSDAKWRKLFLALFDKEALIKGYQWNFVAGEVYPSPEISRVLRPDDLVECRTADGFGFPVAMPYREIESLLVITEHPDQIIEYLNSIALFKFVSCADGFKVLGYE